MKSAVWKAIQLPLLMIELRQLATARRTYVVRFCYAAVLFSLACWLFYGANASDTSVLGRGRDVFLRLFQVQFWALCVLVPAVTCGVIAEEKGRDTLGVLLLSPLGGVRITTQKLLSRLVPMFSFVLLSLPLLAVAYSYGGVSNEQLGAGIVLLLLACAQIGSLSVLMSVWGRTTMEAMVMTYAVFAASVFTCLPLWPIYYITDQSWSAVPLLVSVVFSSVCIALAATSLVSRAFQNTHNYLLQFQLSVDRFVADVNRMAGGIRLFAENDTGPGMHPVRWRETDRKSLGRVRYLARILILTELPLIFVAAMVESPVGLVHGVLRTVLWTLAIVLLGAQGATTIAGERSRGTLDVLLTTPLAGESILREKLSGLIRLLIVVAAPLLTLFVIEYVRAGMAMPGTVALGTGLVFSGVSVFVLLPFVVALSVCVSTRVRSQTRASLIVLAVMGFLVVGPVVLFAVLRTAGVGENGLVWLGLIGPAIVQGSLSPWLRQAFALPQIPVGLLLAHLGLYAAAGFCLWRLALRDIDRRLGRVPDGFVIDESQAPEEALAGPAHVSPAGTG